MVGLRLKPTVYLERCKTAGKTWMALCVLEVFYFRKSGDLKRTVPSSPDNLHKEN